MTQALLQRGDARTVALRDTFADLLDVDGPRVRLAGMLSGLDVRHDLGDGHPLRGRRMPDLDLTTSEGPRRVYELLHTARHVLLDLGGGADLDVAPWADRVEHVVAAVTGPWELPVVGVVRAPTAVLVRPDGHVAWVGEGSRADLEEALTTWCGPPARRRPVSGLSS